MTDADFLPAIIEDPGDDTPRLVYADFLEEQGSPRGEFIRVQCALDDYLPRHDGRCSECGAPDADFHAGSCRRQALRIRERELLNAHLFAGWTDGLRLAARRQFANVVCLWNRDGDGINLQWRRGFVAAITLPTQAFLAHAAELFRAAPIEEVRLSGRKPAFIGGIDGRLVYFWQHYPEADDHPHQLPNEILLAVKALGLHIDEHNPGPGRLWQLYFDSEENAYSALNAGCVSYGRSLANLPPLRTPRG